ncbi:MAG TPA: methyltransferase domain-containing protein [Gemmatimonadaceae bacterium]
MTPSTTNDDYVLGTGDEEIRRLGIQHSVWRRYALDAWRRAGFDRGQHIIDVGCGPGYATVDLAALVGATGRVTAIDRSAHFLEALAARQRAERLSNVTAVKLDLADDPLPSIVADGAWSRWVFAFVSQPRKLLQRLHGALRVGAPVVFHEYFEYGTWRLAPRSTTFEEFVQRVMSTWRADGGEPNVALDLLGWLPADGFRIVEVRPIVEVISPLDPMWEWPASFVTSGVRRLVALKSLTAERGNDVIRDFAEAGKRPAVRMITPAVLEIIAVRE